MASKNTSITLAAAVWGALIGGTIVYLLCDRRNHHRHKSASDASNNSDENYPECDTSSVDDVMDKIDELTVLSSGK